MGVDQPEMIQRVLQHAPGTSGSNHVVAVHRSALGQPAVQGKWPSLGRRLRRVPDRELDLTQVVLIGRCPLLATGVRQVLLGVPDGVGTGWRRKLENREQEAGRR